MAEVKQTPVVDQQPPVQQAPQAQPVDSPAYKQITSVTGTENWTHDIFDCFKGEDNLCLKGTFCPCFVFGKTQARIRDPSLATYERINNDCLLWVGANCCHVAWVLTLMKRMEIRETYHIKGDTVTDCLFSAFCHCCALIQQEKEVIAKQTQQGLVSNVGYQAPAGMSANPNSTGVVQ